MSAGFDLIVRNADVATATDRYHADIGVSNGVIAAIAASLSPQDLAPGGRCIDAQGRLVTPGGVDSHCHISQPMTDGSVCADDFASGSRSAAAGGTTTFVPFALQQRGQSLREALAAYHRSAHGQSVIDYAFHMIVSDPTDEVIATEFDWLVTQGVTSIKIYLTYEDLKLSDRQILRVLAAAKRTGIMTMVHAENFDCIEWLTEQLLAAGITEPLGHAMSRPAAVEREATHRAISLAEVMRVPILLVHVSAADAIEQIRWAHGRGLRIYGETCPQYLFLTEDDLALEAGGARCICSPPPRDQANQQLVWDGLANGAFEVLSSDHAPFRSGADGKVVAGAGAGFHQVPNGIPGLETRLALLMSEGVNTGRIDIHRFVALTSTQAAKLYGLHPRKGTLAVGSDADLVVWHDAVDFTLTNAMLHHAVDYTPYEGMRLTAWPALTLARGEVVWQGEPGQGEVCDRVGRGQFVSAALSPMAQVPRRPGARHHWLPKG